MIYIIIYNKARFKLDLQSKFYNFTEPSHLPETKITISITTPNITNLDTILNENNSSLISKGKIDLI